jgi:hypothetical protein
MKITDLLSAPEMSAFNALLAQASEAGAGAIRYHSAASNVAVIGICQGGELLTWFCAPAHGDTEALVVQGVILSGIAQASAAVAQIQGNAANVAQDAINKASKMH